MLVKEATDMSPQSSKYVTRIVQICKLFLGEKEYEIMYTCYTVLYCKIDMLYINVQ